MIPDPWALPGPWHFALLALAAYRLTRLAGWDEFPLAAKLRAWVIGEHWVPGDHDLGLPGKQPSSMTDDVRPAYRRPVLAHLIHCPYCIGAWISFAVFVAYMIEPRVIYGLAPLALSGAVGLIAKNWDP